MTDPKILTAKLYAWLDNLDGHAYPPPQSVIDGLRAVLDEHDLLHANNAELRDFIAELADGKAQWRLVAPSGHRQVFPREAVLGGAPWPEGWRMETRDVSHGEWQPVAAQPSTPNGA